MCRGFQEYEGDRLRIKAFYVNIRFHPPPCAASVEDVLVPDSFTLHYLPRINGSSLVVNETRIRPDSPAFVTLHRQLSQQTATKGVIYGSRDRVRASEGATFEIYLGDVKVLRGVFRKAGGEEGDHQEHYWKMECKCAVERDGVLNVREAEVCVLVEGEAAEILTEKVEVEARRKRKVVRCFQGQLEEIPELEGEAENESDQSEGRCCYCSDCNGKKEVDSGGFKTEDELEEEEAEAEVEAEAEGVGWAVDVGIWVMCLGVGFLVSRASSRTLRRRKFIVR